MGQTPSDGEGVGGGPRQSVHLLRDASIGTRGRCSGRNWAHPSRQPHGGSAGTGGWRTLRGRIRFDAGTGTGTPRMGGTAWHPDTTRRPLPLLQGVGVFEVLAPRPSPVALGGHLL